MSLPSAQYRTIYAKLSGERFLDPRLVEAVVMTESSGLTDAVREEPQIGDRSRGLMQVLERTARGLGFPEHESMDRLFEPSVGVLYGVKLLAQNLDSINKGPKARTDGTYAVLTLPFPREIRIALARYNGGWRGNPQADGTLRNEAYVAKVERWFRRVQLDLEGP